jgi:DNA-binding Lrp family transcriptional regulator
VDRRKEKEMPKPTIPIEELIALHSQGLTYSEIGRQVGISPKNVRKRILRYEEKQRIVGVKEDKPIKRDYGEITTYYLPREEIERRYGRVGLFKERPRLYKTYGYPDMGQKNERHFSNRCR